MDKVRCHRCNHPWSGITPSTKQPAAKAESAEAWAAHAAVAASTKAVPAPASQRDGVKPDAPPAQEDSDDIEGMEQVLEQLRGLGFSEGSSALDELSKKVEEAKARRAAAKLLWAQKEDLRGKITRKQQQISKLR